MGQCLRAIAAGADGGVKPARIRFYFDADILGLGKLIGGLRSDCTYPTDPGAVIHERVRPPCSITNTATDDQVWIERVSAEGLVIVTRDAKIPKSGAELSAVREHSARLVALAGSEAGTVWTQLEVFMSRWRQIERVTDLSGPLVYRATRTALTQVPLVDDP